MIQRAGIVYRLADNRTHARANWVRCFKLPSLYALGNPIIGNQELRQERSEVLDLTIERHFLDDQMCLSLALIHNRFMDQVDLQETPLLILVNRSDVVTREVQLQASFKAGRGLMLTRHVDYLETNTRGTTEELRKQAQQVMGTTDPLGQRRARQLHPFAGVDCALAVEREMVGILGYQHMRQQPRTGQALTDSRANDRCYKG